MQTKFERELHQTQKMLEGLLPPRHIQDALDASNLAAEHIRMLEKYNPREVNARLDLHNGGIQRAVGMTNNNEAMLRAADFNSINHIAKRFESHLKPMTEHQKMLDMLRRHAFSGLTASEFVHRLHEANPTVRAIEEAKKSLDRFWSTFRDIDFSQLVVSEADELKTKQAAETITQGAIQQESLQAVVRLIVLAIQAEQKPTVQLMLWLTFKKLMDWLIAGVIGAAMGHHYAPLLLDESPQAAKKAVLENARTKVGAPQLLQEYRYISAKLLIARQNPRASSPEIGRLSFGKRVKLQNKNKDFALVLWTDKEGGAEIQGWVFSRYLGKFN